MAPDDSTDRETEAPSLEPPSLFGRKKKPKKVKAPKTPKAPEASAPQTAAPPPAESDSAPVAQTLAIPSAPPSAPASAPSAVRPSPPPPAADEPAPVAQTPTVPSSPPPPVPPPVAPPTPTTPALTGELEPTVQRQPWLTGRLAAVVTGLIVGLLIVVATAGATHLCSYLKGTSSCGGPGLILLVAILVLGVILGAFLLKTARAPEPTSTSFLAVGLLSVLTLLFLVGQIFEWWMIIAIPLFSMATYTLSHWVTTTYIEPERDDVDQAPQEQAPQEQDSYDVR